MQAQAASARADTLEAQALAAEEEANAAAASAQAALNEVLAVLMCAWLDATLAEVDRGGARNPAVMGLDAALRLSMHGNPLPGGGVAPAEAIPASTHKLLISCKAAAAAGCRG